MARVKVGASVRACVSSVGSSEVGKLGLHLERSRLCALVGVLLAFYVLLVGDSIRRRYFKMIDKKLSAPPSTECSITPCVCIYTCIV